MKYILREILFIKNKKLLEKLKEDVEMRGFSHYTKDSYYRKTKEIIEYFGKLMKQVTKKELRGFLIKYLRESYIEYSITIPFLP